jgi:hypothetical protein
MNKNELEENKTVRLRGEPYWGLYAGQLARVAYFADDFFVLQGIDCDDYMAFPFEEHVLAHLELVD